MAETTAKKQDYFYALGRRKSATAQVRLKSGKGVITINGVPAEQYLASSKFLPEDLNKPFMVLENNGKFDVSATVKGGGHAGQVEAIRLAIAKALVLVDEGVKGTLRRAELLSRDSRERERKKFGLRGARKQRQFTKR